MKLLTIFIFLSVMQIHAEVYSQNGFNLAESNITVKDLFKKIEKNSRYTIFYRQDQVNLNKKVSVFASNGSIETVMKQVLEGQPLTFDIIDNIVVVKSLADKNAPGRVVSGTVTAETGEPLIGASVLIKGTTNGTSTDVNGKFTISVPDNQDVVLVVKYIGYTTREISLSASQNTAQIRLTPDAAALDEVVVIGYGTVKKRDLTGSVASVKAEDIVKIPTHNALEAIQGRAPGVDITRTSGAAGSGVNITVRGNRSINGSNTPLYIIDGVQGGDISTLNPDDIESIDILKDASSTAIYGAQGANGVIIVTTKKGVSGKAQVSYSAYYGVNGFTSYPDVRMGDDYVSLRREAYRANGEWSSPADDPKIFPNAGEYDAVQAGQWVDWLDLVTRNGSQQNHALSVRGGSDKTQVFLSAGYFREDGQVRNNDFNRYSLRLNLDQTLSSWAKAGLRSQITYTNQNNRNDPLSTALTATPLGVPYNANGDINIYPVAGNTSTISPLTDERPDAAVNNIKGTNVNATAYVELTPIKDFTFRTNLGTILSGSRNGVFNDPYSLAQNSVGYSAASITNGNTRYYNWDNVLTYAKNIAGHSITATAISSYIHSDYDEVQASGIKQLLSSQLFYDLASTDATSRTINSNYTRWDNMAYAGRLNYSFKGKYLLTATGRFDGASRLSSGHKWDFFPSVAAAWNISEENFMKDISALSNLKLRASYGVTGNYGINVYGTQSGITPMSNMSFGDIAAPQYQFNGTIGNPGLGWEKSATTDVGADIAFFKNRLSATIDWYDTKTTGILLRRSLPQSSGVIDVYQNIGETANKGIEIAVNSTNVQTKNFTWSSSFTFSHNNEKITKLINGQNILGTSPGSPEDNSLLLGYPIHSFYTYKKLGIWQTGEADEAAQYKFGSTPFKPGDIKIEDISGPDGVPDGVIDANYDYTYIGSAVPKFVAGLQNTFSYKGIDLGVYLFARYGQMIKAEFLGRYNPSGEGNGPAIIDYWTPENPTNDFPRPKKGASISNLPGYQSLFYVDGSYFKIRNISIGYTLPKKITSKLKIDNLRFYATGSNLLTVAKSHLIKDYDPERGGSESAPLTKQFVFGVNLGL